MHTFKILPIVSLFLLSFTACSEPEVPETALEPASVIAALELPDHRAGAGAARGRPTGARAARHRGSPRRPAWRFRLPGLRASR